jgi:GNAT superfamily N-acetyltransferase
MTQPTIVIRRGTPEDIPATLSLIKELAAFERAAHEVDNTEQRMLEDGFGPNPVFGFHVAEENGTILGIAVYYFRYSTWKGKRLYLEDIVVTESQRGRGIGKLLFNASIAEAKRTGCKGMSWQVLEWNTPAIEFYKKFNAGFDAEWINCSLTGAQIAAYREEP